MPILIHKAGARLFRRPATARFSLLARCGGCSAHTAALRVMACLLLAILWGASLRVAVAAQTLSAPEYKIKAAFLYNFAVLTEWPTNAFKTAETPLTIGVLGKDPFGRVLEETVKGKKIHGRKIEIERIDESDDIDACHLLFISSSAEANVEKIISALVKRPILTVSDIDRFNYRGGMIWMKKEKDEIKFIIRLAVVREAGLKLSSKLLALSVNAMPKKSKEAK